MQAYPRPTPSPQKRQRVRYSNYTKCMLCYAVCFFIPLLWQALMLGLIYPFKLAGTAPDIARNLASAFPFFSPALTDAAERSALHASLSASALKATLDYRDGAWAMFVAVSFLLAWALTLLLQLLWRFGNQKTVNASRATQRAIRAYHVTQLAIWLLNALFAANVWLLGVRFIGGRTGWDYLFYFVCYALNALAALVCFRLAAPPFLSGKHAFFKRL